MPDTHTRKKEVTLVDSSYQPTKAEMEEEFTFPEGMTLEELARLVLQPVKIKRVKKPE